MNAEKFSLPDAINFAKEFFSDSLVIDDVVASTPEHFLNVAKNMKFAAENPGSDDLDFYMLSMTAADMLREHRRLPPWLAEFAADVLEGKRQRPTARGPKKYGNWERDYKLWRSCQAVANKFSLPVYTNNELSEKLTAAEIVGKATGLSADVVIAAYKKQTRAGKE